MKAMPKLVEQQLDMIEIQTLAITKQLLEVAIERHDWSDSGQRRWS